MEFVAMGNLRNVFEKRATMWFLDGSYLFLVCVGWYTTHQQWHSSHWL